MLLNSEGTILKVSVLAMLKNSLPRSRDVFKNNPFNVLQDFVESRRQCRKLIVNEFYASVPLLMNDFLNSELVVKYHGYQINSFGDWHA